ncbi:class I SAM-dependent methyltransferase [Rhizobium sp. NXC24]|uniref:class I SAM-dependent methyltransferase n=1 Tax=Rhizobium sp. NXC24 TaxID=2048897 RepID=UPI000CDF41E4|nr:class I SAM-dependent methyltransferase [Rhizobium sp. NXC24]AVA25728.1 methyltransferase domain-containing protein [Rhizobium sp. NXC24]
MKCRHCANELKFVFLDLGHAPASNDYLNAEQLTQSEIHNPLRLFVCEECWLVETDDYKKAEDLFARDYAYFSSTSQSWLRHAQAYCDMIENRLQLSSSSFVIEVASNDGYLLKNFVAKGIPCLGVEPTDSTADAAEKLGVPTLRKFFGTETARALVNEGQSADLICGNNVYAHVPDINDFTAGLEIVLKPGGTVTLEFPHLMRLIESVQFDTVYHEHFSYLSLGTVKRIFERAGLRLLDVEEIPTHGGSLRVYGCRTADSRATSPRVSELLEREEKFGLKKLDTYLDFQQKADVIKNDFLSFLLEQKKNGKVVAAYGAAAKGNTLMNYAGLKTDLVQFVCDAAPSKQGKFMPGSHIPILHPDELAKRKPDWVVILPWNIAAEVVETQSAVRAWGGKFVVAIPTLTVLP